MNEAPHFEAPLGYPVVWTPEDVDRLDAALAAHYVKRQEAKAEFKDSKRLVCASTCMEAKFDRKPCKCYP